MHLKILQFSFHADVFFQIEKLFIYTRSHTVTIRLVFTITFFAYIPYFAYIFSLYIPYFTYISFIYIFRLGMNKLQYFHPKPVIDNSKSITKTKSMLYLFFLLFYTYTQKVRLFSFRLGRIFPFKLKGN